MRNPRLLAKLLRRLGLSQFLDVHFSVATNVGRLRIPLQRGLTEYLLYAAEGGFKADLIELLADRGLFSGVVCDVGMNTGQTLLELFGTGLPIRRYYGFEPNPTAFAIVKRMVMLNPVFSSVVLMPFACSDDDAPMSFFAMAELDNGATLNPSIRPDWYSGMSAAFAASYKLDSVVALIKPGFHFFLKIDVEGGELQTLQGAEQVLAQWRPVIQCEVLHAHRASEITANDRHKADIANLLAVHGYLVYQCQLSACGSRLESLELLKGFPRSTYSDSPHSCDYLFLPSELSARLSS